MRPQGTRVWRKTRRATQRGIPQGRRATHKVETAWGQQHELAASLVAHREYMTRVREQRAADAEAAA